MLASFSTKRLGKTLHCLHPPSKSPCLTSSRSQLYTYQPEHNTHPILGIETSCDDTAVAIVTSDRRILAQRVIKQDKIHYPWNGIVPILAANAHQEILEKTIIQVMEEASMDFYDLKAIAFTRGPGLGVCLKVGLEKARELAKKYKQPLLAINHMEGHALVARLIHKGLEFPYLALLISGGHSQFHVVHGVGNYSMLGETLDVAIGDAFDKVARLLEISPLNGGSALEQVARNGNPQEFPFPLPMRRLKNCNLSFSGLETVTKEKLKEIGGMGIIGEKIIADLAASFQHAAIAHLKDRLHYALDWCKRNDVDVDKLVLSGGVACNQAIQRDIGIWAKSVKMELIVPPKELCTDNGVMIAWAGHENWKLNMSVVETGELQYMPRWALDKKKIDYYPGTHSKRLLRFKEGKRIECLKKYELEMRDSECKLSVYFEAIKMALGLRFWEKAKALAKSGLEKYPGDESLTKIIYDITRKEENFNKKYI